jgi:transcriptional regulator with XRE-family HTH domain
VLNREALGLSRQDLMHRAGVAMSTLARIERGDPGVQLNTLVAVTDAVGLDLVLRVYPGTEPGLRDTGQLVTARALCEDAHPRWKPRLEVPAGDHARSADLVFYGPDEVLHVEIERHAVDFQAQLRRAVEKRGYLAGAEARPVRLVIVVEDLPGNRAAVTPHLPLIRRQLPAGSREILAALRHGTPLGRDGILWFRTRRHSRSIGQDVA